MLTRRTRGPALMLLILLVIAGVAVYGWWEYTAWPSNVRCQINLHRGVWVHALQQGKLVQTDDVYQLSANYSEVECPRCRSAYVYRPFDGEVQIPPPEGAEPERRMIAWCPKPCHRRYRNVLVADGTVFHLTEEAFQNAVAGGFVVSRN